MQNELNDIRRVDSEGLVRLCVEKNSLAWSEFMKRYRKLIFSAISRRLSSHGFHYAKEDLQDLSQGFFLKIWKENSLVKIKKIESLKAWLCISSCNFATSFYRRNKNDTLNNSISIFEDVITKNGAVKSKHFIKDNSSRHIKKRIEKKLMLEFTENIIDSLDVVEKLIFKLNVYHDKGHRQISQIINMPKNTVSSILRRARQKIKQILQEKS